MKHLLLSGLSILLMSTAAVPAIQAETVATNSRVLSSNLTPMSGAQPRPFELVYLAFQGYLSQQGIPSNDDLIAAYESGKVTPKTLVQSAVEANRLSANVLNDQDYISAVGFQLRELRNIDRGS